MTGPTPEEACPPPARNGAARALGHAAGSLSTFFLALLLTAPAIDAAPSVETVLARMDSAAAKWKGMRARVQWTRYRSLVDEETVESGGMVVRRAKSGDFEMLLGFTKPNIYYFSVRGTKVEIYKPRIKEVQEYDLGKSRDQLENALLIGFGVSGSFLGRHYDVAVAGEEEVDGHPTVELALEPRNPEGRLNNRRLEMWISTQHWQPVQQKVYERNPEDFRIFTYSDVEINPAFRSGEFRLRLERGTKRTRPQR